MKLVGSFRYLFWVTFLYVVCEVHVRADYRLFVKSQLRPNMIDLDFTWSYVPLKPLKYHTWLENIPKSVGVYRPKIWNSLVAQKLIELCSLTVLSNKFINRLFNIWFVNHQNQWVTKIHSVGWKLMLNEF